MKYSQILGIFAAVALIISCYFPWIHINSLNKTITGVNGYVNENYTFGKQIIAHSFFCIIAIICFSINKIGAKRTNIFICLLNLSWAIKNFIIFRLCRNGDCPETQTGIYIMLLMAVIMQAMTFLPKIEVKNLNNK